MSRLSLLVDLASLLSREVDLDSLLRAACERLAESLRAERATLWLVDQEAGDLVARVAVLPEVAQLRLPLSRGVAGHVARTGEVVRVDDASVDPRFDPSVDRETGYRTRSMLAAPVRDRADGPVRGVVQVLNRRAGVFDEEDERFLVALALQLGHALSLTTLRASDQAGPGVVLRGPFNHIVGRSAAMDAVYERVALAARAEATVLFRGETGTGKTLFARAVHVNSPRQAGPFVTVDCTTLPSELVESELFGHERGAFTGADRRVKGRVELADGGTLFLDEIGELPPAAQAKLLRFLQDRTFERVGGRETLMSDARILCATHRDLEALVETGAFREDLYYRVRVVEVEVPPLRERGADEVLRLARHFLDLHARRAGVDAPKWSAEVRARLVAHDWPGNVRELEHWMESALVLADRGAIAAHHLPAPRPRRRESVAGVRLPLGLTLAEASRRYAAATLEAEGGHKARAADRLGIGRNTITRLLKE
ncbi:MAG: sigma-54-dependent Fis family transcriptional regulator [Myxococcales bacterium]|nr:sigma-54-dependent Fis family transcriptional regulator [Myxococcales bacterium]